VTLQNTWALSWASIALKSQPSQMIAYDGT
jgi:hypothetical protein